MSFFGKFFGKSSGKSSKENLSSSPASEPLLLEDKENIEELVQKEVAIENELKHQKEEIENKLIAIQQSTRVTFPVFAKLHNDLRQKYSWYYNWHLWPFYKLVHSTILSFYILGISIFAYHFIYGQTQVVMASSTSTYTYAGVTNPAGSTTSAAYLGNPGIAPNTSMGTEVSTANYTSLGTSDTDRYVDAEGSYPPTEGYRYYISTPATLSTISQLTFTHIGYVAAGTRQMYVWNFTNSVWNTLGSADSTTGSDSTYSNSITITPSNYSTYINASRYAYFKVYASQPTTVYTNQAKLVDTYVSPPSSVSITAPVSGNTLFIGDTANVTWNTSSQQQIEANSTLAYDNFNDNSIDTSKWLTPSAANGITPAETGGEFKISGTASGTQNTLLDTAVAARLTNPQSFVYSVKVKMPTATTSSDEYGINIINDGAGTNVRNLRLRYIYNTGWTFDYYTGSATVAVVSGVSVGNETSEYKTLKIVYNTTTYMPAAYVYDADGTEHFIGQMTTAYDMTLGGTQKLYFRMRASTVATDTIDVRFDDFAVYPLNSISSSNFDSYTNGSSINGQGGWTTSGESTYGTYTVSNAQSVSASNSMLMTKNTTSGALTTSQTLNNLTTTTISEFDLRPAQTNVLAQYSTRGAGGAAAVVKFQNTGYITALNGIGASDTNLQTYSANTWYHVKVVSDPQRQKYDVYVNGSLLAHDYGFYTANTTLTTSMFSSSGTTAGTAYVDNLQVYSEFIPITGLSASGTSYSWNTTGWTAGTTYLLRARTYSSADNLFSAYSYSSGLFTISAPSAPVTPSISSPTASATGIAINPTTTSSAYVGPSGHPHTSSTWQIYNNADLASNHLVWSDTNDSTNKTSVVVNSTNGTFANDLAGQTSLANLTNYWVQVAHTNDLGTSAFSTAVQFQTISFVAPPSSITTNTITTTGMNVGWTDNSNNEEGFHVYTSTAVANNSCTDAGTTYSGTPSYTAAANATSQAVSSLSVNTQYCFKVTSFDTPHGDSTAVYLSAPVYTLANTPNAPTISSATTTTLTVTIDQNSNPSATTYAIYNQTAAKYLGANGVADQGSEVWQTYSAWGGATGITNTGLSANTSYTYAVKAKNGAGTATALGATAALSTAAYPTISGTSNVTTSGATVAVAVNGTIQSGKTSTISGGNWSIPSVTVSSGQTVTLFISNAATADKTTAVVKYVGSGDITSVVLNKHVLTIGNSQTMSFSVTDLGQYDYDNDNHIMHSANSGVLNGDAGAAFTDETMTLLPNTTLTVGTGQTLTVFNYIQTGGTLNLTGSSSDVIGGNFTMSGGTFIPPTTMTYQGGMNLSNVGSGTTYTAATNTVFDVDSDTFNVTTEGVAFNNLTITKTIRIDGGSPTLTLMDDWTINGTFTITKASANYTYIVVPSGARTINANSDVTLTSDTSNPVLFGNGANLIVKIKGNYTQNHASTRLLADLQFVSTTADQTINYTAGEICATTWTMNNTGSGKQVKLANDIAFSCSDTNAKSNVNVIGGTFNTQTYTLTVTGNYSQSGSSTFLGGSSTSMMVKGTFALSGGTFNAPPTLTVHANFTLLNIGSGATYVPGASTVFDDDNILNITSGGVAFNNVTITKSVAVDFVNATVTIMDNLTVNGNLVFNKSSANYTYAVYPNGTRVIYVAGNLTLNSDSINPYGIANGTDLTIDLKGNYSQTSAYCSMGAKLKFSDTTKDQTFSWTAGDITGIISVDKSSYSVIQQTTSGSINNLTTTSGKWYTNGQNLTVTGTFTNNATLKINGTETLTFTKDTTHGTVEYAGSGTYASLIYGNTYKNLLISGSGSFTAAATTTLNGDFTLNTASGTFVAPATLNIAGNFNRTAGTFTNSSGSVVLNGTDQAINGSTTFYNLTKTVTASHTLTFQAGQTQTISNSVNFAGASNQLLKLYSSAPGTRWGIVIPASKTLNYLSVKDSDNSTGTFANPSNSTNEGDNLNWFTLAAASNVAISSPSTSGFTVTWSDNSPDETGYKVFISTSIANNSCSDAGTSYPGTPDYTAAVNAVSQAVTGKSLNSQYCAKVITAGSPTDASPPSYAASPLYTLVNTPSDPTITPVSSSILSIGINANSNPSNTTYTITCDSDTNYLNHTTNSCSGTPDWQTASVWGTYQNTGLGVNTSHTYKMKARNGDNVQTSLTNGVTKYTLANIPTLSLTSGYNDTDLYNISSTINPNNNPAGTNYYLQYSLNDSAYLDPYSMTWQSGTSYTFKKDSTNANLLADTQYYLKVKAKNGDGVETSYSASSAAVTPPTAPTGLSSSNIAPTSATISWGGVTDATSYTISYGTDTNATNLGTITGVTGTSKNLTNLSDSTQYYFKVLASNANGSGPYSTIANFTTATLPLPLAPTDFHGTASTNSIDWAWSDSSTVETGYRVKNGSNVQVSPDLAADTTSWNETSLSPNTSYTRYVQIWNNTGTNNSNESTLYTLANTPAAPTVSTVSSSSLKIVVNQNSNPSNTRYAIFNQTANKYVKQADGTLQDTPDWQYYSDWGGATGFTNIGLTANTSYTYEVKAENGDNVATSYSSTAAATTLETYSVTINTAGTGTGSLDQANQTLDAGSNLTITATPAASSTFTSFTGCDSVVSNVCHITNIAANKTITATFTIKSYTVTINTAGTGSGTLDQSTGSLNYGSNLTITATPAANSTFTSFTGCDSTNSNVCTISNITANKTITATFTIKSFSVDTSITEGLGSVTPITQSVNYGSDSAPITITPAANYYIKSITADGSVVANSTTKTFLAVTGDHNLAVAFGLYPAATLQINSGASKTNNTAVTLNIAANSVTTQMMICVTSNCSDGTYESLTSTKAYTLPTPSIDGSKTIYLKVKDSLNHESAITSASITLDTTTPSAPTNLVATPGNTSISLSWTNPTDADFAKVAIFRDTNPDFMPNLGVNKIGNTTNTTAATYVDSTNVVNNTTYYYKVEALDDADNYSLPSNQANAKADSDLPTTPGPITISNKTNTGTGTNLGTDFTNQKDLNLAWTKATDVNSGLKSYTLSIGTTSNGSDILKNQEILVSTLSNPDQPAITLSTIAPTISLTDGTYYLRVLATDNMGNVSASSSEEKVVFDTAPPVFTGSLTLADASDRSISSFRALATFNLPTDSLSGLDGMIITRDGTPLNLNGTTGYTANISIDPITHIATYLDTIDANKTYTYKVIATDLAKNTSTISGTGSIINVNPIAPGQGTLTISNVKATASDLVGQTTEATITWTSSIPATSEVYYGLTSDYDSKTDLDNGLNTAHTVILDQLAFNTTYHFKVVSLDSAGKEVDSSDFTFTTNNVLANQSVLDTIITNLSGQMVKVRDIISLFGSNTTSAVGNTNSVISQALKIPVADVPATTTTTAATIAVATAAATPIANAVTLFSLPEYIRAIIFSFASLATKRKKKNWGRIIEAGSNLPIAQAKIKLIKLEIPYQGAQPVEKLVQTTYSDNDGAYAFIAEKGKYILEVEKDMYHISPVTIGSYRPGDTIEVKHDSESLIIPSIALTMSPEETKKKYARIKMIDSIEKVLIYFSLILLLFGTLTVVSALLKNPHDIRSLIIAIIYPILWYINIKALQKNSPFGDVEDQVNHKGVPLALVRFMDKEGSHLVKTAITNEEGKYKTLINKGQYQLKVAKAGYTQVEDETLKVEDRLKSVDQHIEVKKTTKTEDQAEIKDNSINQKGE